MSQKKPIRQDYIAKVRYTNNLPAPPLNPKFLQYNVTEPISSKQEAQYLMSSLFRKENFISLMENLDEENGMNLNLINNVGFLDDGNESVIYGLNGENNPKLHTKDRELLRDAGISNLSKSDPGVSFLRRTEYIAEKQAVATPISNGGTNKNEKSVEQTDPESQLKAVEATFDIAQETLMDFSKLSHPKKKHLKPVSAWPLLPDTSMLDTKYLNLRFVGSASINREIQQAKSQAGFDEELHKDLLKSTIFKPITSEDGEWLSLFQLKDTSKSKELLSQLNSTEKEQPVNLLDEDEDKEVFAFKHVKNYDMKFQRFSKPNEELAIKLIPESSSSKKRKAAYYYPITGRIDLKKYRVATNREVARFLKDSTIDQINFLLREPTTNELKKMDTIRSEYDPMEYEGEEDEEDDDDGVQGEEGEDQKEHDEQDVATEFNDASKEAEAEAEAEEEDDD
jgi:RNA polymerase II-associated factor 1